MELKAIRKWQYLTCLDRLNKLLEKYPVDIHISDNTTDILDPDIAAVLRKGTIVNCFVDNHHGAINKGAGIMTVWLHNQELYKNYDYVIWFEPRTLLISDFFLREFFASPSNLFTFGDKTTCKETALYTGIFAIQPILLEEYLSKTSRDYLCERYICIEDNLGEFLKGRIRFVEYADVFHWPARTNRVLRF